MSHSTTHTSTASGVTLESMLKTLQEFEARNAELDRKAFRKDRISKLLLDRVGRNSFRKAQRKAELSELTKGFGRID